MKVGFGCGLVSGSHTHTAAILDFGKKVVLQCLKSAMRDVWAEARLANRMDLRKEYVKLFSAASNNSQVSSVPQWVASL